MSLPSARTVFVRPDPPISGSKTTFSTLESSTAHGSGAAITRPDSPPTPPTPPCSFQHDSITPLSLSPNPVCSVKGRDSNYSDPDTTPAPPPNSPLKADRLSTISFRALSATGMQPRAARDPRPETPSPPPDSPKSSQRVD
jgi:hypothetical protein